MLKSITVELLSLGTICSHMVKNASNSLNARFTIMHVGLSQKDNKINFFMYERFPKSTRLIVNSIYT